VQTLVREDLKIFTPSQSVDTHHRTLILAFTENQRELRFNFAVFTSCSAIYKTKKIEK